MLQNENYFDLHLKFKLSVQNLVIKWTKYIKEHKEASEDRTLL